MDSSPRIERVIVCLLLAIVFAGQAGLAQSADSCSVRLYCQHAGLRVWADDRHAGTTPSACFPLPAGTHTLRAEHPRTQDWLTRDWVRSVELEAGEVFEEEIRFSRVVWVGSNPQGAELYEDASLAGRTPTVVAMDGDSLRDLTLVMPGYRSLRLWMEDPLPSSIHGSLIPYTLEQERTRTKLKRGWIVGSAVLGVVSGILGYYFRWRADRAYEAYREAMRPETMDRAFDDAVRFDRWSGWCYGTGEVSLGVSLTLFIRRFSAR